MQVRSLRLSKGTCLYGYIRTGDLAWGRPGRGRDRTVGAGQERHTPDLTDLSPTVSASDGPEICQVSRPLAADAGQERLIRVEEEGVFAHGAQRLLN